VKKNPKIELNKNVEFDEQSCINLPTNSLPLISVIIANYNASQYVCKAIDSVLNQDLKNLEVIIVDDASTDNSVSIMKEKYGNNSKVKIYRNSTNLMAGGSRNKGLENAKGKYIFFVDSDDWIEKGTLIHLASIAETYNSDIVSCGSNIIQENGEVATYHSASFECTGGLDALNYYADYRIGSIIWDKLYLRELLERNKIRFQETYLSQDVIFALNAIYVCQRYISISNLYYNYFQSPTSLIRSAPSTIKLRSYINLYKQFIKFIKEKKINKNQEGELLALKLVKAHCSTDIIPKLINYIENRGTDEWKNDCIEACDIEFGKLGYAFSDYIISSQEQLLLTKQTFSNQIQKSKISFNRLQKTSSQQIRQLENSLEKLQNNYILAESKNRKLCKSQNQLTLQLQSIYESKGWRFILFVRRCSNRIFPQKSIIRRFIFSIYRLFKSGYQKTKK
jgi:glycosyltransferase involved in cell wall biosynthesis